MLIYDSYIEAGQNLKRSERERFYRAIIEYLYYGSEPKETGNVSALLTAIMPSLRVARRNIENGKKGGRPRKPTHNPNGNPEANPEHNPNGNPNGNPEGNPNETQSITLENKNKDSNKERRSILTDTKKKETFSPPSATEVYAYAASKGHPEFDSHRFIDYYTSNGWKVGRNPMKDWKAAVRTWLSKEDPKGAKVDARFEKYR